MGGSISKMVAGKKAGGAFGGMMGKVKGKIKDRMKDKSPGSGKLSQIKAATDKRAATGRKRAPGSMVDDVMKRRKKKSGEGGKL